MLASATEKDSSCSACNCDHYGEYEFGLDGECWCLHSPADHGITTANSSPQRDADEEKYQEDIPPSRINAPPPCQEPAFRRWFPSTKNITKLPTGTKPRLRLICFHCAGGASSMFTTPLRRPLRPNGLVKWALSKHVEILAVELPGRDTRSHEKPFSSARAAAEALAQVVGYFLCTSTTSEDGFAAPSTEADQVAVPYAVLGHSMGTWVGFELVKALKTMGFPSPCFAAVSAFPPPSIPLEKRPWKQNKGLTEDEFKEECRSWGVNEIVFSEMMWPTYHGLMKADFTVFDEYTLGGTPPSSEDLASMKVFECPLRAYYASADKTVKARHVEGWKEATTESFKSEQVEGPHLFPLDVNLREAYFSRLCKELDKVLVLND